MAHISYLDAAFSAFRRAPPALTAGLMVFFTLIHFITILYPGFRSALVLTSRAITGLDLNRLSFYPIVHANLFHLLLNTWALFPLVRKFELSNGTVRTGIVLNILSVVPGLAYAIIMILISSDAGVLGSSGWFFSFLAYYAVLDHQKNPVQQITSTVSMPTWATPLVPLIIGFIIFPGSSFLGHCLGIGAGYAMALGYLDPLIEPSTNVVEWIENRAQKAIALIPPMFQFIDEVQARERRQNARGASLPTTTEPTGPTVATLQDTPGSTVAAANASSAFAGQGRTLNE